MKVVREGILREEDDMGMQVETISDHVILEVIKELVKLFFIAFKKLGKNIFSIRIVAHECMLLTKVIL